MGRIFPGVEKLTSSPSIISISLLIACIIATFVVVSSLCGFSLMKKSSSKKESDKPDNSQINTATEDTNLKRKSLPESSESPRSPPKLKHARSSSYHFQTSASFAKLTSSMSTRLQGGMNSLRQSSVREDRFKEWKEKTFRHEDSICKKQIILGEKCRVPDEDDDTILYDEKGDRYITYHPKRPATLPSLSRQGSTHEIPN
ncbi:Regulator of nonsense transcripts 3B like [Heracleum sosnowskyi]|uniref:Regulator of nonsense transcripts 3B like n=1 Tax=Heracleum sosnowskyi TaxID=360622 RepID=A0AAD8HP67_9APIA|nr:Regulator of nonsense transcripts 3B like [Heracleum sosnowskyi]